MNKNFEPATVEYSQRFSWDGKRFPIRPGEKSKIVYRRKRNIHQNSIHGLKNAMLSKAGIFVNVQKVSVIDEYLIGSPRSPFKYPRRLFLINIISTQEPNFDDLTKKLLEKLWIDYALGNVAIITACPNEPEVLLLLLKMLKYHL